MSARVSDWDPWDRDCGGSSACEVLILRCWNAENHVKFKILFPLSPLFQDINAYNGDEPTEKLPFPIIDDKKRELAILLGMLDPAEKDEKGMPVTARVVSPSSPVWTFEPTQGSKGGISTILRHLWASDCPLLSRCWDRVADLVS